VVVFDRYVHDMIADPRRYRYRGPAWLLHLTAACVPQPQVCIFLDAPADVLQARKQEVTPEETARQRAAYLDVAQRLGRHACVVDATRPPSAVALACANAIRTTCRDRADAVSPPVTEQSPP
jgi:thymidylate kinase